MRLVINNKRGDSTPLSIFFILMIVIIGTVIIVSMAMFFRTNSDIRSEEASSLSSRVIYELSDGGRLNEVVLSDSFDLLERVSLDPEMFGINGDFYINVEIISEGEVVKRIIEGNKDFEIQCALNGESLARCSKKSHEAYDKNGNKYQINVFTGSNQIGSRF